MVHINFATREIITKIVYFGPTLGGKTSILKYIDEKLPPGSKGKFLSITNDAQETIFFDHLPVDLGQISGMNLKLDLYAVPGKSAFSLARKNVLQGADGLIFVADSQQEKIEQNLESLEEMAAFLENRHLHPEKLPLIFQYHKQDLPGVFSPEELTQKLNPENFPHFSSSVVDGKGILSPLKKMASMILDNLYREEMAAAAGASVAAGVESDAESKIRLDRERFRSSMQQFLESFSAFKVGELKEELDKKGKDFSRRSITRHLNTLIDEGTIKKKGYGKGTVYYVEGAEDEDEDDDEGN